MKISVIVTCYNNSAYIEGAIKSSLDQSLRPYEVIVIDDNSSDDSISVIKKSKTFKDVRLLKTDTNSGASAARNLGIKISRGDYVAFLDGDDFWLPGKLKEQSRRFQRRATAALVYTDSYIEMDGTRLDFTQSQFAEPKDGEALPHLLKRNCINLCSVLIKKEYALFLFDENLRQGEDYDLWIRVAKRNNDFIYIDKPLVAYRRTGSGLTSKRLDAIEASLALVKNLSKKFHDSESVENLRIHKIGLILELIKLSVRQNKRSGIKNIHLIKCWRLPKRVFLSLFIMKIYWNIGRALYLRWFTLETVQDEMHKMLSS